jgi:hypothetical protein
MKSKISFIAAAVTVFFGYFSGILTVLIRGEAEGTLVTQYLSSDLGTHWLRALETGPLYVVAVFLCGVFFFGWLAVLPLIFYKCYGLGYSAGLFLAVYGTKGFLPLGLCLFPSAAAECLLLIRAGRDAIPQSFLLFRGIQGDATPFYDGLKGYFLRSIVIIQCSSFVLLWDLFLSPMILSGIRDLL